MSFIDEQIAQISDKSTKIVFPEGNVPNIMNAAAQIVELGFAKPILIGDIREIREIADSNDINLQGIEIISPMDSDKVSVYAQQLEEKGEIPPGVGQILMKKNLYFGAAMVNANDADCVISGIVTETDEVISTYKLIIGMQEGVSNVSSFVVLENPGFEGSEGNRLVFADTAINIDPTVEELADIAITSAYSVKNILGWEPRVAMLSFSTLGSTAHERAVKVADAVKLANEKEPSLLIDGEMQLDTAIVPAVAERKFKRPSAVAGKANVLVFPGLEAANIGSKILQRIGKSKPYGAVLQGFKKPASDVSRGASAENILGIAVLLTRATQSKNKKE